MVSLEPKKTARGLSNMGKNGVPNEFHTHATKPPACWRIEKRPFSDGHYLIVQRNELSCLPQSFFPRLGVAFARDAVSVLSPIGYLDRMRNRVPGNFGGEDDLQ